jgi:hypothetical protein
MGRKRPAGLININRHHRRPCDGKAVSKAGGNREARSMKAGWRIVWLAVVTFAVAFGAAWLLVPDVVPVGYSEEPQASWALLTAFVLRAIELTAAWVAAIALVVTVGAWAWNRGRQPLS